MNDTCIRSVAHMLEVNLHGFSMFIINVNPSWFQNVQSTTSNRTEGNVFNISYALLRF
jgi:hypothetical protein